MRPASGWPVVLAALAALILAACQNTPPPAAQTPAAKTATVGKTTITTGGRVRVDASYEN